MRYASLIFCLFLVTGCDESLTGPTVPLNTEFVLAPGSSAVIEDASISVRFDGVTGDSRCPGDAICIQGGDAIVAVTVTSRSGTRNHELHTGNMEPVKHDDVTIALVQLAPYPFASQGPIRPDQYRATLRATK